MPSIKVKSKVKIPTHLVRLLHNLVFAWYTNEKVPLGRDFLIVFFNAFEKQIGRPFYDRA
jgi:hypothetical protein